jgi:4-hydroxy-4-methyl-2-oxoglutarate aldolase
MPIAPDLLSGFAGLGAATVYEGAGKIGDMAPAIRPLFEGARLCGPAFTVKCFPGDLRAMMAAVDLAHPGDVLVIDGGGSDRVTTWGGAATVAAKHRGLAGVVTNGCARDGEQIRSLRFPVFAAGHTVRGGLRNHPGWTAIPVSVGDVVVQPGDLVIGDLDGVVVVAAARLGEVLERSLARRRHEEEADFRLGEGVPYSVWTGVAPR